MATRNERKRRVCERVYGFWQGEQEVVKDYARAIGYTSWGFLYAVCRELVDGYWSVGRWKMGD